MLRKSKSCPIIKMTIKVAKVISCPDLSKMKSRIFSYSKYIAGKQAKRIKTTRFERQIAVRNFYSRL
tara:strand:- start:808 stop:1008 length:201 start_codon:yes stop_codon:yes gene_type:complete